MTLQDTIQTLPNQYGVDVMIGLSPNAAQSLLIAESELGQVTPEKLDQSIKQFESELSQQTDPKVIKDLQKKLENLKKVADRPQKDIDMILEDKWKSYFTKVDTLINGLDANSKKQLLSNVFINENPKWHPERNSLVHIKIVAARGVSTGDNDLIDTALFHDIAKFDTVSFNNAGWPTSLGHDKKGAESAKAAGKNETVIYICNNHMKIKGWQGDSEGGTLNPSTKYAMFAEAPGVDNNEKAKAFWKLCVFSKMDNMSYDFNADKLKWDNPTYDNWDAECPLKEEYKKAELVEVKVVTQKQQNAFTPQEIMAFGAKGPQIGQINKEIVGKSREESFEIIKGILGNPDLKLESKKWIHTFESFRNNR
jgi:hypothetical protein